MSPTTQFSIKIPGKLAVMACVNSALVLQASAGFSRQIHMYCLARGLQEICICMYVYIYVYIYIVLKYREVNK